MVMIELKDICKSFGDHVVLKNFSLKINDNEFIAIIGESGAGKTTILNMISMIDKPDSGSISINGKNSFSKKDVQDLRRYVFGPFVKFTVKEVAKGVKQVIRSPDLLTAGVKRISLLITLITLLAFKMELLTLEIAFNNFFRAFIDMY